MPCYSAFVERVRQHRNSGIDLRDAINNAIKWGIDQEVLTPFLAQHRLEVQNMLLTEFNMDIAREVWREEAREEGREEGIRSIVEKMRSQGICDSEITNLTGISQSELQQI